MMSEKEKLVWQDDFSGDCLDRSVWKVETGYCRNKELQCYVDSPENIIVQNGQLILRALKTDDPECPYTSASIHTRFLKDFQYGRLEIRAKVPTGQGIWPAFWTCGTENNHWPDCGEIDIFEIIGGQKVFKNGDAKINCTLHCPELPKERYGGCFELREGKLSDDFHVYGINWTKQWLEFYFDNYIFGKWNISETSQFQQPHYVRLNVAVGGTWPGPPDETTEFPKDFVIDWIRYYQDQE